MSWSRPTRPLEKPAVIDTFASLVVILGYYFLQPYCRLLFMGTCDTTGSTFFLGLLLIAAGSTLLAGHRVRRVLWRRRVSPNQT